MKLLWRAKKVFEARHNRRSAILLGLILGFSLVLGIASRWLVPTLITQAYNGEAPAYINRLITGQAHHSLEKYLSAWQATAAFLFWGFLAVGLLIVGLVRPWLIGLLCRIDDALGRRILLSLPKNYDCEAPRGGRQYIVTAVIAGVLGGSFLDILFDREHWPFSPYSMYASVQGSDYIATRLYGVTDHGEFSVIPKVGARPASPYLGFDDQGRFLFALHRMPDKARREALSYFWRRYDRQRSQGLHSGPSLRELKLYRMTWRLDPSLPPSEHPLSIVELSAIATSEATVD